MSMPKYSVEIAIYRDKPHPMKAYHIAKRLWNRLPYEPNEKRVKADAKMLESLIDEEYRNSGGLSTTELILEIDNEEKLEKIS